MHDHTPARKGSPTAGHETRPAAEPHAAAPSGADGLLRLQRAAGNHAIARMIGARFAAGAPDGGDAEREAEGVADAVVSMPAGPEHAGGPRPEITASAERGRPQRSAREQAGAVGGIAPPGSGGSPLTPSVREFFESRFDRNFGAVRVFTGAEADRSARSIGAAAYASGNNIVFGAGRFTPDTTDGRRLIAHELTHVVQQSAAGRSAVQRAPDKTAPPPKFYKALEDEVGSRTDWFTRNEYLEKVLALCIAVDEGKTDEIPALVDAMIEHDAPALLAPYNMDWDVSAELISRTYTLGLPDVSQRLRDYFRPRNPWARSQSKPVRKPELRWWEKIVEDITAKVDVTTIDKAATTLDLLLRVYKSIRDVTAGIDETNLKRIREQEALFRGDIFGGSLKLSTDELNDLEFFNGLLALLTALFPLMQKTLQPFFDKAIADVGAPAGDASLKAAKDALAKVGAVVFLDDPASAKDPAKAKKYFGGLTTDVTTSRFAARGSKHFDSFQQGDPAKGPSVNIGFFDKDQKDGYEVSYSIEHIYEIRRKQIAFLERLRGTTSDTKLQGESKREAADIGAMGGFALHSNDDLRKFADKKYTTELKESGDPGTALTRVIKFLEAYYDAFTMHTPYDIDDFADDYLSRTFPRALTGQLIHDCGVLALRTAYILSLLRTSHPELKLRFRFIRLPVHVGLVITGDGLPAYIAHNNSISVLEPARYAELKTQWEKRDESGNLLPAPRKATDDQFLGELASGFFIQNVDLPYRFEELPVLKAGSTAELKTKLSQHMRATTGPDVLKTDLPGDDAQFHLQYLAVIEAYKRLHNNEARKFWNIDAWQLWEKSGPGILAAVGAHQSAAAGDGKAAALAKYEELVKAYLLDLDKAQEPLRKGWSGYGVMSGTEGLARAKKEIGQRLAANPKLVRPGATVAHGARIPVNPQWQLDLDEHISAISATGDLDDKDKARRIVPKFSKDGGQKLESIQ